MTDLREARDAYERARHALYDALIHDASNRLIERLCAHVQAARERVLQLETEGVTA